MTLGYSGKFWDLMFGIEITSFFVYVIELDGKIIYVGQTRDIMGRLRHYKCTFLKRQCHNPKLQELFDNRELERAMFRVVAMASTRKEIFKMETELIQSNRDTCLNKYDTFVSEETRRKLSNSSRKMWTNKQIRNKITSGISKKHVLTSPDGIVREFSNSYAVKSFLKKIGNNLHPNDKNRIGYQMLESCGENKGWKMVIEGRRPPCKWIRGTLKTPTGEEFSINGKWELVRINRERKFRLNVNRLLRKKAWNGFEFLLEI